MNIFSRIHTLRGLYEQNKALLTALEVMEEELNEQIEKLQDENEYLKDELSYSRVRNNRLDEEIKTVRERDFKDIYPALQAENKQLIEKIEELTKKLEEGDTECSTNPENISVLPTSSSNKETEQS